MLTNILMKISTSQYITKANRLLIYINIPKNNGEGCSHGTNNREKS